MPQNKKKLHLKQKKNLPKTTISINFIERLHIYINVHMKLMDKNYKKICNSTCIGTTQIWIKTLWASLNSQVLHCSLSMAEDTMRRRLM